MKEGDKGLYNFKLTRPHVQFDEIGMVYIIGIAFGWGRV